MIPGAPRWLVHAWEEAGTEEIPGPESNPEVEKYHDAVHDDNTEDDVPWCSSFVCWCVEAAGYDSTNSRAARSWLDWGVVLEVPLYGCVCILWRGRPTGWKGHVGFYLGEDADSVFLLSGNQSDEVNVRRYPKSRVLGYRSL